MLVCLYHFVFLFALCLTRAQEEGDASLCDADDVSIRSQADMDRINSVCGYLRGNVEIFSSDKKISLGSLIGIGGDLVAKDMRDLQTISAPSLQFIGGTFHLQSLTLLRNLEIPSLYTAGSIKWVTLPALTSTGLSQPINECKNIHIADTALATLAGIRVSSLEQLDVNNNRYLKEINLGGLNEVKSKLEIAHNGKQNKLSIPDLVWADSVTLRDVHNVNLPKLASVNKTLSVYSSDGEKVEFPSLINIGGTLAVVDNKNLKKLSFSKLKHVGGGFLVANNTELIDGIDFTELEEIGGAVELEGAFSEFNLKTVDDIRGGVFIKTSSNFDCNFFSDLHSTGVIKGDSYTCISKDAVHQVDRSASRPLSGDGDDKGNLGTVGGGSQSNGSKKKSGNGGGGVTRQTGKARGKAAVHQGVTGDQGGIKSMIPHWKRIILTTLMVCIF